MGNNPLAIEKGSGNKKLVELEKENKDLKEKIVLLENKNKDLEKQIKDKNLKLAEMEKLSGLKISSNDSVNAKRILELVDKLCEMEKELKELKEIKSIIPFDISPGEKLMSVIFVSVDKKIHHPIICKNSDDFVNVEKILYNKFPEYQKSENSFTVKNNKINRFFSMDENKIVDGDIITLKKNS